MKRGLKNEGFTVIEVSLTLAIAGLIFLMVLVALPPLQRSQRDTARRENVQNFITQIKKYQSSNRGMMPNGVGTLSVGYDGVASESGSTKEWGAFYNKYLGTNYFDADGSTYTPIIVKCSTDGYNDKTEPGLPCLNDELVEGSNYKLGELNYNLMVVVQSVCDGDRAVGSSNPRNLSVLLKLEGAGIYCNNS